MSVYMLVAYEAQGPSISIVHRPQSRDVGTSVRPRCLPNSSVDPLGTGYYGSHPTAASNAEGPVGVPLWNQTFTKTIP